LDIHQNISIAPFTTFGIGGPARFFIEAGSEEDIVAAAAWVGEQGVPLFVLGGGTNLLVSDSGFDGLVLRVNLHGIDVVDDGPQKIFQSAAGDAWENCVQRSIEENCAGLECLAGIPGTVGGTPVQNVGAYGQEVSSVICQVRAFDLEEQKFCEFSQDECGFAYRRSRFNTADRGRYIVTRVDYRLTPGGAPTLRYADLKRAIEDSHIAGSVANLAEVAATVREIRLAKGMLLVEDDTDCRSAGSFFKNPVVNEAQVRQIAKVCQKYPPQFPAGPGTAKIPAAWLIEQAGFARGYAMGAAAISSRHTLALVNRGGATAEDILALADQIYKTIEEQFGIHLEMEPVLVGF
jgi:UDP-N-acetylmuramate dehydrogenase